MCAEVVNFPRETSLHQFAKGCALDVTALKLTGYIHVWLSQLFFVCVCVCVCALMCVRVCVCVCVCIHVQALAQTELISNENYCDMTSFIYKCILLNGSDGPRCPVPSAQPGQLI